VSLDVLARDGFVALAATGSGLAVAVGTHGVSGLFEELGEGEDLVLTVLAAEAILSFVPFMLELRLSSKTRS